MINIGNNDVLIKLGNADVQAIYLGNEKVYPNYIPQYRWYNLDPSIDYYCSGTTKYYKQQYQISKDSGTTWENVVPAEYQMGSIAQCKSVDCGYVAPTTEWKTYTSTETQPYGIRTYGVKIDTANIDYPSSNDIQLIFEDIKNPNNYIAIVYYTEDEEWHTICSWSGYDRLSNIDENFILTEDFNEIARCNDFIYAEDIHCNLCEIPTEFQLLVFDGKWNATYLNGMTALKNCDASSAITQNEIALTNLVSVEIGNCVTSIGKNAFNGCNSLNSCTIGSGVTSIGSSAFWGCNSLTSCTIGSGVTSIGDEAFRYCISLTSIDIPNNVTQIGNYAFSNCRGLTSCTISSGVTSISIGAFQSCTSLTSIDIPNSVTSIYSDAFAYCYNLSSVTIPDSVTHIYMRAFQNCSGLTSINIPSSVAQISGNAFKDCISLTSITINATTPPVINGDNTFDNTNNCPIYVPSGSVNAYKTASGWSKYASRIQAIPNS